MRFLVASALALTLGVAGCGEGSESDRGVLAVTGVGTAEVAIPLEIADITSVLVSVSGSGITGSITAPLAIVGDIATGLIAGIPAGLDRTFYVEAKVDDVLVCTGVTVAEIVADTRVSVNVMLDCSVPPAAAGEAEVVASFNFPPEIVSVTAAPSPVLVGGTVALEVVATDSDGDALTYSWTAADGTFDDAAIAAPVWTAPAVDGSYDITVEVSAGTTTVSLTTVIIVILS
jgi:hypothetical protein